MQLRKIRKKKSIEDEDLGYEEKPPKTHKKAKPKVQVEKDQLNDEVFYYYFIILIIFPKIVFEFNKRT